MTIVIEIKDEPHLKTTVVKCSVPFTELERKAISGELRGGAESVAYVLLRELRRIHMEGKLNTLVGRFGATR